MRTKEFIKQIEELGYKAHNSITQIDIVSDGLTVALVSIDRMHVINSFCFVDVEWKNQDKLFDLICEYAKTPIEEREEPKKYYLRHKWMCNVFPDSNYLNRRNLINNFSLNNNDEQLSFQTKFTREEIDEIKEKYNTDLSDFEVIEVEE